MPNQIINEQGMYTSLQFTGSNGTWVLVGSESSGDSEYSKTEKKWYESSIGKTIDTFRNTKTGERLETTRMKVYKSAESGTIFL